MRSVILLIAVLACGVSCALAAEPAKKSGLEKRVPWTASKVVGTPDPPHPYRLEQAFPKLKFFEPLAFAPIPGGDRLLIAERPGKIWAFKNDAGTTSEQRELALDVAHSVYGMALHPQFEKNGYVYLSGIVDMSPTGSRVTRYQATSRNPLKFDPASATTIFEWPAGGHNGGCLKFGPDGFLYLVTGDGSGIADELQTGQDISDVLASMLRFDVDHPANGKQYGIPKDNPFVDTPGARPEVYAYGLRQSWRFSFDRKTGDLWAGEVGQDLWESVLRIEKGGNYGWSLKEATHPFRPERKPGPTPVLTPVVEHNHNDFRSITGGFVYQGSRLPELKGCYLYADYDTGRVWALRYEKGQVSEHRELVDTALRLVEWGEDQAGELYVIDFTGGQLYRLAPAPPPDPEAPEFPRKLSETGLFSSTATHTPMAGLIPYEVNSQLWSDGATKQRFLAIPGDGKIGYNAIEYPQPAPGAPRGWRFPDKTVVVKTFSIEMEAGNPASSRRLETRILHFEQTPGTQEYGDQVWNGYTYIWNEAQTDAELLSSNGLDRELIIKDKSAPGGERKQVWHFPSRAECTLCHTQPAKFVLGVNTLQLNRDHNYDGVVANQLATFEHIGLFEEKLPAPVAELPKLPDYADTALSAETRARAYLHSNCSHCHMKWGGGNAEFQLLSTLPLNELGVVNVKPAHGAFGLTDPKLLIPGKPEQSMIYSRMTRLGLGRMPHVGSNVVHEEAVKLVGEWIRTQAVVTAP